MASRLGIGAGIGIPFRNIASGGGKPYLSPEVKEALKAVVIAYGKTNNDSDRAVVKNLVDASNPFIISNAAFKLNSGFGKYEVDFTTWSKVAGTSIITDSKYVLTDEKAITNGGYFLWNRLAKDSFKVKISNIPNGGWMSYRYRITEEDTQLSSLFIREDGIYTLPATVAGSDVDFFISTASAPAKDWVGLTITQIPSFEGAFVTDGIDDLITSTKTVQDMLEGSNEITVVSMIGQLSTPNVNNYTNTIRNQPSTTGSYNKVEVSAIDKTGIYGYSFNSSLKCSIINDILGDKQDYSVSLTTQVENISAKYLVQGWIDINGLAVELSSVAWYWTIIANKVLTTDQINQVIAYYNLDRCVEPTVLYDVKRQGLSNDTPDSDWYLKDFSKNGFDMSLFNFAKKRNSGVGKYETDFLDSSIWKYKTNSSVTSDKIVCNKAATHIMLLYYSITDENKYDVPSFNVLKQGDASKYYYIDEQGTRRTFKLLDGINTLPASHGTLFTGTEATCGFGNPGIGNSVTITQIPSHAGALCLDGVNDFGKVTGMPVYKDYTVVTDREIFANIGAISSKNNPGAFVETAENSVYSFGQATSGLNFISTRSISYLSKYSYCGQSITAGEAEDGTDMWLGTIRDNDSRFFNGAIYSLMTFPYSMSEFLIERQLKKHKLGTPYPDMVEFRPIVKSNSEYQVVDCYIDLLPAVVGKYYPINSKLRIAVTTKGAANKVTSLTVNGVSLGTPSVNGNRFTFNGTLSDKSPQKINITIDEYIRFEDIVQPYPVLLRFNDENGNEVSWGGKFRVGSTITRIGGIDDTESNLLNGLYSISGLSLNGKAVTSSTSIVEKQMVFKTTATYLLDNNEPNCILSPRLLRIPNSSYKILGYIPDISGHGNHGKINNSAYAGMSGANGYVENFTTWGVYNGAILTDNTIKTNSNFNPANSWVAYKSANTILNSFSVNITGIPEGGILNFRVNADTFIELSNGRNDLSFDNILITVSSGFRITKGANLDWSNLVIQQIGEYEGAYCLDGVDDFVTIPTIVGGKQVLMKVNSLNSDVNVIYDQRLPTNMKGTFAIICDNNLAYSSWNTGQTYIDGILNKNIIGNQLVNITHNLTITNDEVTNNNSKSPFIGKSTDTERHANMSLYDFMLFDNISTDDKIKELNEYVGIEGNTE